MKVFLTDQCPIALKASIRVVFDFVGRLTMSLPGTWTPVLGPCFLSNRSYDRPIGIIKGRTTERQHIGKTLAQTNAQNLPPSCLLELGSRNALRRAPSNAFLGFEGRFQPSASFRTEPDRDFVKDVISWEYVRCEGCLARNTVLGHRVP